jgi:hypothetical protein
MRNQEEWGGDKQGTVASAHLKGHSLFMRQDPSLHCTPISSSKGGSVGTVPQEQEQRGLSTCTFCPPMLLHPRNPDPLGTSRDGPPPRMAAGLWLRETPWPRRQEVFHPWSP